MIIITGSTAFVEAAYDQSTMKLMVEFKTGTKYAYDAVTQTEVDSILAAVSRGQKLKEIVTSKRFTKLQ